MNINVEIDVPDDLYQELEKIAAEEGMSVPEVILAMVRIQYPEDEYPSDDHLVPSTTGPGEPANVALTDSEIKEGANS